MDTSVWILLDIIFVGAGVYSIYAFILLKTTGEVKTSILLGKDVNIKKCKDIEAYKSYIAPKLLIFGIACTLYGLLGIADGNLFDVPLTAYWVCMAVFFAILIWFAYATKKSVSLFW